VYNYKLLKGVSGSASISKLQRLMLLQANALSSEIVDSLAKFSNVLSYRTTAVCLEVDEGDLGKLSVSVVTRIVEFFKRHVHVVRCCSRADLRYQRVVN
jgi:hypothetical protein